MPLAGFQPAIPATKRPQTYALGRAATGIGFIEPQGTIKFCELFVKQILFMAPLILWHPIPLPVFGNLISFPPIFSSNSFPVCSKKAELYECNQ
jgi:hypothetical protein